MTLLSHLCETSYFRFNSRIRSDKTKQHYRFALGDLARVVGHPPTVEDLTDDNVTAVMMDLLSRGRCERTANERRDRINALWTWLAKRGIAKAFPTTLRLVEPERIPLGWMREELPVLFEAFEQETSVIAGVPGSAWWKSLHHALWNSSERIGALVQCTWQNLNPPWLVVPAEVRKGKRTDRAYKLSDEAIASIESIRQPARNLIWPWPYNYYYLWTRYRIIRERAGLPIDRYSSFHRMRKSVASHFEALGGNAMQLLGHSSRRQTLKYLDPRIVGERHASELLFSPIDKKQPPGKHAG
jgi:integrase